MTNEEQPLFGGFYDDEGNNIKPLSIPVPGLCLLCKSHDNADTEENLLCIMNRYDQRSESNFICGAYEKSANYL